MTRVYIIVVLELAEKLKRLAGLIDAAGSVASRIESQNYQQQGHPSPGDIIRDAVAQSNQSLRIYAEGLGKLGQPKSLSTLDKIIKQWCFERSGKSTLEKAVEDIDEQMRVIGTALHIAAVYVFVKFCVQGSRLF